ncbi:MAG: 1-acyl-sn-glycerol-3-phosphate acyltransferase [Caldilineaceae bacterium]|nr:1-acyl-sn-glycerol-3-phosphate acyltransferase [Caldilineaceae bacterium]
MLQIRAAVRLALTCVVLGVGALVVLLLSPLPWRVGGAKVATWPVVGMARAFVWLMGIRYHCPDPDRVRQHAGLIFCNHTSFIDTLLILYLTPARFLSTKGVRKLPLIGQIAVALDTIFVHRYKDEGRAAARADIAEGLRQRTFPPLAIFPEGKIGPGHTLLPFRYGAFEIAKAESVAILPCALVYEPLEVVTWFERNDSLISMAWQLALQRRMTATLLPLDLLYIRPDADVATLAEQTREQMQAAISRQMHHHGP